MILEINPDNPQPRLIARVVDILGKGGIIAYPTDTTYGIGCSILNKKGIERIYLLKQREKKKPFSRSLLKRTSLTGPEMHSR